MFVPTTYARGCPIAPPGKELVFPAKVAASTRTKRFPGGNVTAATRIIGIGTENPVTPAAVGLVANAMMFCCGSHTHAFVPALLCTYEQNPARFAM
jgi:hypothetical protein